MERVIVSVERAGHPGSVDLELGADLTAEELVRIVPAALGWPAETYHVAVTPPGRTLRPDDTLAQAHAWDGALLTFRVSGAAAPAGAAGAVNPGAWKKVR